MSQYPTIQAGQRITASLLQEMLPLWAVKAAATSRASTVTLADDPDLVISIPRTGTWAYEVWLNYTGGVLGSSDLKVRMNYSGTSSFDVFGVNGINTTATSQFNGSGGTAAGTGIALGTSGSTYYTAQITGTVVATTTGNLSLQWSQNTSSATATNLRQGCWIRAWQLN